ncbi:small hydrophobic protein [Streptomyces sp. NPDC102340]|uniref:small hydrophobic protein n=1 Tax=unclassified Streptomyces TaxID=2593676 RepID=UPI002257664C|nr:small hydrophobic protein [Streptomyces sp. NBC_01016]MCX4832797.1 small hydrophobic protein [Streptomyces sp. NBC_01016]
MMAGFGHTTRKHPRSRGRAGSRTGPDRASLGIIGLICAIVGFFSLGIVFGPVAVVCGWLAMGRRWTGTQSVPALIAVVLGAIVTLLAVVSLASAAGPLAGGAF